MLRVCSWCHAQFSGGADGSGVTHTVCVRCFAEKFSLPIVVIDAAIGSVGVDVTLDPSGLVLGGGTGASSLFGEDWLAVAPWPDGVSESFKAALKGKAGRKCGLILWGTDGAAHVMIDMHLVGHTVEVTIAEAARFDAALMHPISKDVAPKVRPTS